MINTNNETMIKERCEICREITLLKNEYKVQECMHCGSKILPIDLAKSIKVKDIEDVTYIHENEGYMIDFQFSFSFDDCESIDEYLTKEGYPHHIVFCEVDCNDGILDLDNINTGISYYCEDSYNYDFSEEQVTKMLAIIINQINIYNIGEIKISKENYLLVQKYALKTVQEWLGYYSYSDIAIRDAKDKDSDELILVVEDITSQESNTAYTLSYWSAYFLNEIKMRGEVDNYKEDFEMLLAYLNLQENLNKDEQEYVKEDNEEKYSIRGLIDYHLKNKTVKSPKKEVNLKANSLNQKIELSYNLDVSLLKENDLYIAKIKYPLTALMKNGNIRLISKIYFLKDNGVYKLHKIVTTKQEDISVDDINELIGLELKDVLEECSKLCQNYLDSYISFNNKKYEVNNILDFIKLEIPEDILIKDTSYNLDFKGIGDLEYLLITSKSCKFKDVQSLVKNNLIYGKDVEAVAIKYCKRCLPLTDEQLKYFDYKTYFINTSNYFVIDDYIVCIINTRIDMI